MPDKNLSQPVTDIYSGNASELRKWSLARADEVIATEFNDEERLDIWSKRTLIRACMAVGILSEHMRTKSELDELRYLQSEVDQGDHIIRKRERERCANLATGKESNEAGDYISGWNDACDSIADAIRELADE